MASLFTGTSDTNKHVANASGLENQVNQLTLNQLNAQGSLEEQYNPILRQYIQDLLAEQAIRNGQEAPPMYANIGGPAPMSQADILKQLKDEEMQAHGLKSTGYFDKGAEKSQFVNYAGPSYGTSGGGAMNMTDIYRWDDAKLAAEAKRRYDAQASGYSVDQEATDARNQRIKDQIARETNAQAGADRMNEINQQLAEINLKNAQNAGKATPDQIENIDAATNAAQSAGEADIDRFRTDTLRKINEEVASASGLRPTDKPIVALSERAGEESARQQGILTSNLRAANANARLNFPLAQSQVQGGLAQSQQQLGMASEQFQAALQQRAQDNRFRLFSGSPTNTFAINPAGFSQSLSGFRAATANTTTNSTGAYLGQIADLAGGLGKAASGGAALFG